MRYLAKLCIVTLSMVGLSACACSSKSQDVSTVDPPRSTPTIDSTRRPVKTYLEQPPVRKVNLTTTGEVSAQPQFLAVSPSDNTWVAATAAAVQHYRGDAAVANHMVRHVAAGAIDFSADGKTLLMGLGKLDLSSGKLIPQPPITQLTTWLTGQGLPAPASLTFAAARYSRDGKIIVASATGRTRDSRDGARNPTSGSEDWLLVLDGVSREPARVLWHGRGPHNRIAISKDHIVAGGVSGLKVFARTGAEVVDLTAQLQAIIAVAWSPDGAVLAALGERNKIALWKAGAWNAPVARFALNEAESADYGSAIAFHPTRPLLLTGDRVGYLRMWQVDAAHLSAPVEIVTRELGGIVNQVAITAAADGLLVAVGAPLGKIHRYRLTVEPQ